MPKPAYVKPGLTIARSHDAPVVVRALQRALRALGYLKRGIDGDFGRGTEKAVRALQLDLIKNVGQAQDGSAPVSVLNYNQGRVEEVTGVVDQRLAACIADMMADQNFPKLPRADDPKAANRFVIERLLTTTRAAVPMPFLVAMLKQESNLQHYNIPRRGDEDTFVTVGLDTNSKKADEKGIRITSRGYGAGQFTLFHHPPTVAEVQDFMIDPAGNLSVAIAELRGKFDGFVNGTTSGTRADDRFAEVGGGPLRECRYEREDVRFMRDCAACLQGVEQTDIEVGMPYYAGSSGTMKPTQYYRKLPYAGVPVRRQIPCDWPYASRRYNGSGVNSYHYQAIVLLNLLKM